MAKRSSAEAKRRKKAKKPKAEVLTAAKHQDFIIVEDADNPFAYGDGNPQPKVRVTQNRLCDPLIDYGSRGYIDQAQKQAGLHFQNQYRLSGATAKAMDPTNEPVDGGGAGDAFTDARVTALIVLIEADRALQLPELNQGHHRSAYRLVEQVCGHGNGVKDLEELKSRRATEMHRLRRCLDILAHKWGYAQYYAKGA